MTDNAADGQAITEIQMGAAAAPEPTVVVAATLADAAGLACQDTTQALAEAVADRGVAHVALTGGSGGVALAEALAPLIAAQPEPVRCGIHLWFGDERFVPMGDPERNDMLATPLIAAGVRESQVHRLAAPQDVGGLDEATARMVHELESAGLAQWRLRRRPCGPGARCPCLLPLSRAPGRARGGGTSRGRTQVAQAPFPALLPDLRGSTARRPGHGGGRRRGQGRGSTPGAGYA